jgi:hypothetical protein
MFVLYLLNEDTLVFDILSRPEKIKLSTMRNNESVWMVPNSVRADD